MTLAAILLGAFLHTASAIVDLHGVPQDPFQTPSQVKVLLFVRTGCPITNRYAPELRRLSAEFQSRPVHFWLIYADKTEKVETIQEQLHDYGFPGTPLLDPQQQLAARAGATVAPEAAVFEGGTLRYIGRIDNRWVDFGKSRPTASVHDLEDAITATLTGHPVRQKETRAIGCSLVDLR